MIKNTIGRNGLKVWRRLYYWYDPQIASRTKDSFSQIVYTSPVAFDKLSHAIEIWEEQLRQHVYSGKQPINESLLCEALIKLCPKDLSENINYKLTNM